MRRIICLLVLASASLGVSAQRDSLLMQNISMDSVSNTSTKYIPVFQYWKDHDIFQHLDFSVTLGTTGVGFDVASPIGKYVQVRAGFEIMPRFTKIMKFDLTINGKPVRRYDENGNRIETPYDKLKEFMYDFTGLEVEDHADMEGKPTINNAKFLVDVFPFKNNKHWRITAGIYWGPSQFAEAVNTTETMVSLVSCAIYNKMYDKAINNEPLIDFSKFTDLKNVGMTLDSRVIEKFKSFGRLGFAVGYYSHDMTDSKGVEHKAGERYILEPDEHSMVSVVAKSNPFKPYIGFGYGGSLLKGRDDWRVSFDCGAMFWGGTPDLIMHDGMNLIKDVENIGGQVGTYVNLSKAFKVYPVLSFRLTKRIF